MSLLADRDTDLAEWMDAPDCDALRLANTYRYFTTINTLISGWDRLYRGEIRPILRQANRPTTLLDIGSGGGDLVRRLAHWTANDGFDVRCVGADPDPRAMAYARSVPETPPHVRFVEATSRQLVDTGEHFDIVISNHLLHHLTEEGVRNFCEDSRQLATRLALHTDIQRSPLAYAAFPFMGIWFHDSFILDDGLRSIRRSFTSAELSRIAPEDWQVRSMQPFRLLLSWTP